MEKKYKYCYSNRIKYDFMGMKKTILSLSIFVMVLPCIALAEEPIKEGVHKTYYANDNLKTEWEYKNGKRNGISRLYYKNGNLWVDAYLKDGKQFGKVRTYYKDGSLQSEGDYKDGEGFGKGYYENGKLKVETYSKDNKTIWEKRYDEKGNLIPDWEEKEANALKEIENKYPQIVQIKEKLKRDMEFIKKERETEWKKEGGKDGIHRIYYPNGNIMQEWTYKDGKIAGVLKNYSENGNLKSEVNYKNGEANGFLRFYDDNGKLRSESIIQDFEVIDLKTYDEEGNLIFKSKFEDGNFIPSESKGK